MLAVRLSRKAKPPAACCSIRNRLVASFPPVDCLYMQTSLSIVSSDCGQRNKLFVTECSEWNFGALSGALQTGAFRLKFYSIKEVQLIFLRLGSTMDDPRLPLYIVDCGQQKITNTETFCWPFHQFVCCSQGEGIVLVDRKEIRLAPGTVLYMKPNVEHEYLQSPAGHHVSWVSFNGNLIDTLSQLYGLPPSCKNTTIQDRLFPDIHLRVMSILEDMESPFVMERSSVTLYGIIVEFFLQFKHNRFRSQKNQSHLLEQAIKVMRINLHGTLEIGALARDLDVTRQHLSRLFRKRFNMTPKAYYMRLKVLQSKKDLLQFPDTGIKDVAGQLGFVNASHFTKVFHRITGVSPTAFRKTYQHRLPDDSYTVAVFEETDIAVR